jgi:hypothetical protein
MVLHCIVNHADMPIVSRGAYIVRRRDFVESDRHFYMRRVTAERQAAARSVTEEARQRRLVLVETYLQKLQAMSA